MKWIEERRFSISARATRKRGTEYDLIVLDPPSFTKAKGGLADAMRGYRELHVRAFKLLSKEGLLATFSCSHHVSEEAFAANNRRCPGGRAAFSAENCDDSNRPPIIRCCPRFRRRNISKAFCSK